MLASSILETLNCLRRAFGSGMAISLLVHPGKILRAGEARNEMILVHFVIYGILQALTKPRFLHPVIQSRFKIGDFSV